MRVPLSVDEIVAAAEREIGPLDDDVAVFRLVVADQLELAGALTDAVREAALATIAVGADLAVCAEAGMSTSDLKKRSAAIAALGARLRAPRPARPRRLLKAPEPLLFEPGDVLSYPIRDGGSYNPYMGRRPEDWTPDGQAITAVAATGHILGYLAWYAVVSPPPNDPEAPGTAGAPNPARFGTLTREHASRIGLVRIARQSAGELVLSQTTEELERGGRSAAILSISLANALVFPEPMGGPEPGET